MADGGNRNKASQYGCDWRASFLKKEEDDTHTQSVWWSGRNMNLTLEEPGSNPDSAIYCLVSVLSN